MAEATEKGEDRREGQPRDTSTCGADRNEFESGFIFYFFFLSFVNKIPSILPCSTPSQACLLGTCCAKAVCSLEGASTQLVMRSSAACRASIRCSPASAAVSPETFRCLLFVFLRNYFLLPWTKGPTGTFSLGIELKQRLTWYGRCALTVPNQEEEAHDQQQGHGTDRHSFRDHVGDIIVHGVQHFQEHLVIGVRRTKFKAL